MTNTIQVGSVVYHKNPPHYLADIIRGPGTVLSLKSEFGIDAAEILWQSAGITLHHRLESLLTLAEKVEQIVQDYD